jgi:hypothetical protein
MKTYAVHFLAVLLAAAPSVRAQTPPNPNSVSWNSNFTLNQFGGSGANVANPGTPVASGTPPITIPTGTGYPVTDVAAVKALLEIRSALKDSYTVLYNLSDKYGRGEATSKAKDNKGQRTSLPDDIGKIVEALAGEEGLAEAMQKITDALGDPSKAPTNPTKNWSQMNNLRTLVQQYINDQKTGNPLHSPTPAYDKKINNPKAPTDGKSALSNQSPLSPKQQIENWEAIIKGNNPPHTISSNQGATAGGLFEAITTRFIVEGERDPNDPKKDPPKETVHRNPRLYVSAVNQLAAVKHYYQIRDAAIARRTKLHQLLSDILVNIRDAKDFANLGKLKALADLIEGQLAFTNQDINGAFNDVAVRGVQMFAISQMKQTAEQEKQEYEMMKKLRQVDEVAESIEDLTSASGSGSGTTTGPSTGVSATGFLPWHR